VEKFAPSAHVVVKNNNINKNNNNGDGGGGGTCCESGTEIMIGKNQQQRRQRRQRLSSSSLSTSTVIGCLGTEEAGLIDKNMSNDQEDDGGDCLPAAAEEIDLDNGDTGAPSDCDDDVEIGDKSGAWLNDEQVRERLKLLFDISAIINSVL